MASLLLDPLALRGIGAVAAERSYGHILSTSQGLNRSSGLSLLRKSCSTPAYSSDLLIKIWLQSCHSSLIGLLDIIVFVVSRNSIELPECLLLRLGL